MRYLFDHVFLDEQRLLQRLGPHRLSLEGPKHMALQPVALFILLLLFVSLHFESPIELWKEGLEAVGLYALAAEVDQAAIFPVDGGQEILDSGLQLVLVYLGRKALDVIDSETAVFNVLSEQLDVFVFQFINPLLELLYLPLRLDHRSRCFIELLLEFQYLLGEVGVDVLEGDFVQLVHLHLIPQVV